MKFQDLPMLLTRIFRLDYSIFDDVRRDATATGPCIAIAAGASLLSGLGSWLWWSFKDFPDAGDVFLKSFILGSVFQLGLWFAWVYIAYTFLTQLYRANADVQEMVRTMGLAFVPVGISVLMFISVIAIPVGVFAMAAALLLSNVAIQAATRAPSSQVMVANLAGFAVFALVMGILGSTGNLGEGLAPGIFFFALD